jgi:hypothetical protein
MSEVVLLKLNAKTGQRDRLAVADAAWQLLLELGETFGWKPHGARYQGKSRQESDQTRHNYEPGASNDLKYVDAEDAGEWAGALRAARDSTHLHRLVGLRLGQANHAPSALPADTVSGEARFAAVLSEFIDYASAGGFSFARGAEA